MARTGYLQAEEVADLLHVNPKTVSAWAKQGKLPYFKTLGGWYLYPEDEIRALAAGREYRPPTEPVEVA